MVGQRALEVDAVGHVASGRLVAGGPAEGVADNLAVPIDRAPAGRGLLPIGTTANGTLHRRQIVHDQAQVGVVIGMEELAEVAAQELLARSAPELAGAVVEEGPAPLGVVLDDDLAGEVGDRSVALGGGDRLLPRGEELEGHLDRLDEDELAGGLQHVAVARNPLDPLDHLALGVTGEEDDRHLPNGEQARRGFGAVDSLAEVDVHEHEVDRRVLADEDNGVLAGANRRYLVAVAFEGTLLGERDDAFVLDEEDARS